MDVKCVYLLLFFFIILYFIPTTNEQGSMKFRDYKSTVDSKDLGRIVAKSLMKQYHNRKMIDVSKFHYNLHMAWRGVNTFIWKKVLKLFCRPLARELKIGKKLKKELFDTPSIQKDLGLVSPSSLSYQKENSSAKDEKSDEGSEEVSSEEVSDENVKKKKHSSKSPEERKNLDSLFK